MSVSVNHSRFGTDGKTAGALSTTATKPDANSTGESLPHDPLSLHRHLLRAVKAAIIATDLQGEIIYWNEYAEELYGWSAGEVLGRNIMQVTVATETENQATEILSLLKVGKTWTGEFHVLRKDGTRFAAVVTDSPIVDENGALIGIVGVSQDISAQKQIQEAQRKAHQELELRVEQRTQELNTANQSLRALSARLLQMQDDERRHIARELHDSVGQLLAAIGMNIAMVKAESMKLSLAAAKAVSQNAAMIEQISSEIRTISHLLHPPLLDEAGLASALTLYVEGFSERSKINVALDIAPDFDRLPREIETTIFRVVQESLTNIHRHSGGTSASILLARYDGQVWLEIRDTGKGIPVEKQASLTSPGRTGVGIGGMRERLRQLGGTFEIQSNSGGTVVKAGLPLPHSHAPAGEKVA